MDPSSLAQQIESFLKDAPDATVREQGEVLFHLNTAKYSISSERGRCLLHLWSEERNIVRHVLDASLKAGNLLLTVHRLGQARPGTLEICNTNGKPRPLAPKARERTRYGELLQAALRRQFPEWRLEGLTAAMDLEHSFGPSYVRGIMRNGRTRYAVVGVSGRELPATVSGALTVAILWLDLCRQRESRGTIEGVRLFLPSGTSATTQTRMSYLNAEAARWQLFEFAEDGGDIKSMPIGDHGNIATRLVRCLDAPTLREKFAASIAKITAIVPTVEIVARDQHEIAFRLHGLEFARATMMPELDSFQRRQQIFFGAGSNETPLDESSEELFRSLMQRVVEERQPSGDTRSALWRMQTERWLESIVTKDPAAIDSDFTGAPVYSQVPAFAASDRGMIDVLTCTRQRRLAVLELKADEDLHLPLQGLDYWARVKWHHERPGEFQKFGYFADRELSPKTPLLYLVAPALRIHPATDTVLRYFSPAIEWVLVGVDERWREKLKPVFVKRFSSKP